MHHSKSCKLTALGHHYWRLVKDGRINFFMKNKIVILVLIILTILSVLFFVEKVRFPVNYMICDTGYTDCYTAAKFSNMQSCQFEVEIGSWLCNSQNPNDIKCKTSTNPTAVSFCK